MGMAASQARYLALTARKTNTEYEGQQINQARTALANQSANLFNQLLGLEVPTAPKTTDYTELQYSYSDGTNDSVIDSWQQLSTADPNYNYIVNHYYYANVYTGYQKLLSNPEVQTKGEVAEQKWSELAKAQGYGDNPSISVSYNSDGSAKIIINGEEISDPVYLPINTVERDTNLDNAIKDLSDARRKAQIDGGLNSELNEDLLYGYQDANGTWHFIIQDDPEPIDYSTQYKPSFVGNCELTELSLPLDKEVEAELSQVIKDCTDTNLSQYLRFTPEDGLIYDGKGIYSFEMNGKTYFTSEADLYNSMQTYDEFGKPIEAQEKLAYYGANYIQKKIEETNHALLETDGSGRFTSVKFDDDSVVYTLNTETVTDQDAYDDAMNEYNYKVRQYEKTIADINAKTSIIQKEDRTLELRLKQLDTEQNALKTEMDAVKKVISDNVESTFKTFSD